MSERPESVTIDSIQRQREAGWPEFHPETYCHRCGRLNVESWYAPSDLWNAVMAERPFGIVCPSCFAFLAESSGVVAQGRRTWRFDLEPEAAAETPVPSVELDVLLRKIEDAHPAIEEPGSMWHAARCGTCSRWNRTVAYPCPTVKAVEEYARLSRSAGQEEEQGG